jgi:outer membrane protein TolC
MARKHPGIFAKNSLLAILIAVLATLTTSCVKYEPQPLTDDAVERRLAPLAPNDLKIAVSQLRHQVLQPAMIDPQKGITPDEAGIIAVILNPDLRAERDQRAIARAQVIQAGILPNPQLAANVDFPRNAGVDDGFTAYSIGPSWDVTALIAHDAKIQVANASYASVDLDLAWKEWQTAEAAKLAAYEVVIAQATLKAAQETEAHFAQNLQVVRKSVESHEKTLLDLSAAEASAQDARSVVLEQEKNLRHQQSQLNRAIGVPPDTDVKLADEAIPSRLVPPAALELIAALSSRRLDLLGLKMGYESQEQTLRVAVLEQFPKINVGFNVARDTSDVRTVGLGATIDIPIFDRNQGVIASEKATRQKLFDEYVARVFAARSDIATAVADITATNDQIASSEAALPDLQKLVDTYQSALAQGNTDVLSLYAAQASLSQRRIDVIKLKQQLVENWVALEIASGQFLPTDTTTRGPAQ